MILAVIDLNHLNGFLYIESFACRENVTVISLKNGGDQVKYKIKRKNKLECPRPDERRIFPRLQLNRLRKPGAAIALLL